MKMNNIDAEKEIKELLFTEVKDSLDKKIVDIIIGKKTVYVDPVFPNIPTLVKKYKCLVAVNTDGRFASFEDDGRFTNLVEVDHPADAHQIYISEKQYENRNFDLDYYLGPFYTQKMDKHLYKLVVAEIESFAIIKDVSK